MLVRLTILNWRGLWSLLPQSEPPHLKLGLVVVRSLWLQGRRSILKYIVTSSRRIQLRHIDIRLLKCFSIGQLRIAGMRGFLEWLHIRGARMTDVELAGGGVSEVDLGPLRLLGGAHGSVGVQGH
jgi:hypothetical protein